MGRNILILIIVAIYGNLNAIEIDSIKTESDVLVFLKDYIYKDTSNSISLEKYFTEKEKELKQSLNSKSWYLYDFDNNGENDLLVYGYLFESELVLFLNYGINYKIIDIVKEGNCKFGTLYPVFEKKNDDYIIALYYDFDGSYDYSTNTWKRTPLEVQYFIYSVRDSCIINYSGNKAKYSIDQLEIDIYGGGSRVKSIYKIGIDFKHYQCSFTDESGVVRNTLSNRQIDKIYSILMSENFLNYDSISGGECLDMPKANLRFYYGNGLMKKIEDNGLESTFGLMEIYKILLPPQLSVECQRDSTK